MSSSIVNKDNRTYVLVENYKTPGKPHLNAVTPLEQVSFVEIQQPTNHSDSDEKKPTECENGSTDGTMRFAGYHETAKDNNSLVEPKSLKLIRPFLFSNEIGTQQVEVTNNIKSNGRRGAKGKSLKKKSTGLVFTLARPPPNLNNYIPDNRIYRFTANYETPLFTTSTTLPTFGNFNFQITGINDSSAYGAVFDQYRVDFVEVWIIPANMGNTSMATSGLLYSVIDYDDSTNLTTVAQATDYDNVIFSTATEGHYRKFKPCVAVASYSGAFTSYSMVQSPWIDFSSPSVQHYGIKTACSTTTVAFAVNLVCRAHVSVKNVR